MNFSGSDSSKALKGRIAIILMGIIVFASLGAAAPAAGAATSGQLGIWGVQGAETGDLHFPLLLGADQTDGSVYVADLNEEFNLRIQKFSSTGTLEASSEPISTELESGQARWFQGIVVDPSKDRLYLLPYKNEADTETGKPAAQEILVYSTVPQSGKLVSPEGGPSTLPVPAASSANAIDNPQDFVLDPHSGDLVISGENREGKFVLQRIHTSNSGEIGARYTETSNSAELNKATYSVGGLRAAVTVNPQGLTYILTTEPLAGLDRAWTLPSDFSGTPTAVPGFAAAATADGWGPMQIKRPASGSPSFGPQVAISPDGSTLYWKQLFSTNPNNAEDPGSFLVQGYSLADEHVTSMYGGNEEEGECTIQSAQAALAPEGEDMFVLDQGTLEAEESPYGVHVMEFGSGGSLCPAPSASFSLRVGASEVSTVSAGTSVTLDGSASELGSWAPKPTEESLIWKIEGPSGTFEKTVPSNEPSPLTLDHAFTEAGEYTVRMAMKVSGSLLTTKGIAKTFAAKPKRLTVTGAAAKFKLKVTKAGSAAATGKVTSSPTGIECGATCEHEYEEGEVVTLTASPEGSEFKGWTGCTSEEAGKCKVTMSAIKSVNAEFDTIPTPHFKLTVSKSGSGQGTVKGGSPAEPNTIDCGTGSGCEHEYAEGALVTLTHEAASGSEFKEWTGACSGTGACEVTMSAAKSVGAKFDLEPTPPAKLKLTVSKSGTGQGTVASSPAGINCGADCGEEYEEGTVVTLTAAADSGSEFKGWEGACSGTGSCVVGITAAKSVTARFDTVTPPPPSCATDAALCPKEEPKPQPKPLKCKKGFKKKTVRGKARCVKVKKHKKGQKKGKRPATRAYSQLSDWIFSPLP